MSTKVLLLLQPRVIKRKRGGGGEGVGIWRESKRNRDKEIESGRSRKGGSKKKYKTTIATIHSLVVGGPIHNT